MDLPEARPVHVVPVPALAHQLVDIFGAVFRQGKNDLREIYSDKRMWKKIRVFEAYHRQSCDSITNVIVLVQFENILLRCSLIRINRNKLKGLVEILYKCVKKKKIKWN